MLEAVNLRHLRKRITASAVLLVALLFGILFVPLFPARMHDQMYAISNATIFFFSVFTIQKERKWFIVAAVILIILKIIVTIKNDHKLASSVIILGILFFIPMVFILIRQILRNRQVDISNILDAITGYLLLGFVCSSVIVFLSTFYPGSYNINIPKHSSADIFYYGFITFCTVGYGDIIPVQPAAKSLAIFTGMSGQLYIAIIISVLVGKFIGRTNSPKQLPE